MPDAFKSKYKKSCDEQAFQLKTLCPQANTMQLLKGMANQGGVIEMLSLWFPKDL